MASLVRATGAARAALRAQAAAPSALAVAARRLSQTPAKKEEAAPGLFNRILAGKTGKTGSLVLSAGLLATALSKEYILFHEETVVVVSFAALLYTIYRTAGSDIAAGLDARAQDILKTLRKGKEAQRSALEEAIRGEKKYEGLDETVNMIYDVQQDVNDLGLEVKHRAMQHNAAETLTQRLNTIVNLEAKVRNAQQDLLVSELEKAVLAHYSSQKDDALVKSAIDALGSVKI